MHSKPPVDPNAPVNPDFQDRDINLRAIKIFLVVTVHVTIVVMVMLLWMNKVYKNRLAGEGPPPERQIAAADGMFPLLQVLPLADLQAYQALEAERLNVATNFGTHARIPVDLAMRHMVETQAFPVRVIPEASAPQP